MRMDITMSVTNSVTVMNCNLRVFNSRQKNMNNSPMSDFVHKALVHNIRPMLKNDASNITRQKLPSIKSQLQWTIILKLISNKKKWITAEGK